MLKDGFCNRLFVRTAIFLLRAVAPLSTVYSVTRISGLLSPQNINFIALDVYAGAECVFYFLVYLPRKWWLNLPSQRYSSPSLKLREARRALFAKTWECTPDPHDYLSLWFKGTAVESLHREDVKEWISWRMFNGIDSSVGDEDEVEEYLAHLESVLNHSFPKGRSEYSFMAVTTEPVQMMHRPLLWYLLCVGGADFQLCSFMLYYNYRFHGVSPPRLLTSFPLRPFFVWISHRSPSKCLSYWHLPHTSTEHLPILFIHGIGIGLQFYLPFFDTFKKQNQQNGIGMISLEILSISSRITQPILHGRQMTMEIRKILQRHGWSRCVVMSHSYGSVITTHLLRDPDTAPMIGSLLFVDPVTFSFHSPQVAWNFLRRKATTASEIELQYFASLDPDVAYTLTRKFIWTENSLWREEVEQRAAGAKGAGRRCTVFLSGRDIIVDTSTLGGYLTRNQSGDAVSWHEEENKFDDSWKTKTWSGEEPLEVVWYPEQNHAEIFEGQEGRAQLMDVLEKYVKDGAMYDCDRRSYGTGT